ncbi:hypothetical protein J6590_031718, partial [Homalodisca vitripennis]
MDLPKDPGHRLKGTVKHCSESAITASDGFPKRSRPTGHRLKGTVEHCSESAITASDGFPKRSRPQAQRDRGALFRERYNSQLWISQKTRPKGHKLKGTVKHCSERAITASHGFPKRTRTTGHRLKETVKHCSGSAITASNGFSKRSRSKGLRLKKDREALFREIQH